MAATITHLFCEETNEKQTDDNNYTQVVISRGCSFSFTEVAQFLAWLKEECGFHHDLRWIGLVVAESGHGESEGRPDAVFVIHNDDINRLAPRLDLRQSLSISWLEDAYDNEGLEIYPDWFIKKYPKTW